MFEKFGEFGSVKELNLAAAGLKAEGDDESLIALAEENGLDKEDVQDYLDGCMEELATPFSAAFGRLEVEERELENEKDANTKRAKKIILTVTRTLCSDEALQNGIMKKGKRVGNILDAMRKEAQNHKTGNMGIACGTDRELVEIIKAYYIDGKAAEQIKKLYE